MALATLAQNGAIFAPLESSARDIALARYWAGHSWDGSLHGREADGASHRVLAGECRVSPTGADEIGSEN